MRFVLSIAFAGTVLAAAAARDASKELDRLQGTWAVVTLTNDGKAMPPEVVKGSTFVVKGDRYTLKGGEDNFRGKLKLDPATKPKSIEASFVDDEGKDKGKAIGIYELDGDRLKICWRDKGDRRPKEFSSAAGSGARLIILKRQK